MSSLRFEIAPRGPYSLSSSASFLCGFPPQAGSAFARSGILSFGFGLDDGRHSVAVSMEERGGRVVGRAVGSTDVEAVRAQVARILSLDHDASTFAEVGKRNPVIGGLQERFAGLRPVCFYSPYEAAAWAVLASRSSMTQAVRVKARLCEELGEVRSIDGTSFLSFPYPERLAELRSFPGIGSERSLACGRLRPER